ncbi:MAG TPA: S-layer homology domain-containing protein [Thermoanaerobaculia bacterium]|jgi:hypothetical protein
MKRDSLPGIASWAAAMLLLASSPALGQLLPPLTGRPTPPAAANTYGTTSQTIYTVESFDLESVIASSTFSFVDNTAQRYFTSSGIFAGPLHLPSGARVEKLELEGCDTSTTGESVAALGYTAEPGGTVQTLGFIETGTLFDGGCALFPLTFASPPTIDNKAGSYFVVAQNTTYDGTTTIAAVRVYYRLQLSPAPATPTFGDVPADYPYYRAIEALAASGITGGCGNGNFCPGQFVTRGELAKFLANALGLHWPS